MRDGRARLYSRNGNELTARFSSIAAALEQLPDGTVLDGELVVLDADGCPDFNALMRRQGAPCLIAFDLMRVGDRDFCAEPLEERKLRLADLVSGLTGRIVQNTP